MTPKTAVRLAISALSFWAIGAVADSPQMPPNYSAKPSKPESEAMFACSAKRKELTKEQLEEIALAEFRKGGGRVSAGGYEMKIVAKGCDWMVGVQLLPAAPGAHFGVVIDGTTGEVKRYIPGA